MLDKVRRNILVRKVGILAEGQTQTDPKVTGNWRTGIPGGKRENGVGKTNVKKERLKISHIS